jgi:hypothetical protein
MKSVNLKRFAKKKYFQDILNGEELTKNDIKKANENIKILEKNISNIIGGSITNKPINTKILLKE